MGALLLLLQAAPFDELLRQLAEGGLEERDRAVARIVDRWKDWGDAELAKLETSASADRDPEAAGRARQALDGIRARRLVPEAVLRAVPGAEATLLRGLPDAKARFVDAVRAAVSKREIDRRAAAAVLVVLLDDGRETSRRERVHSTESALTVSEIARRLLPDAARAPAPRALLSRQLPDARIGDVAALLLARRWGLDADFRWPGSTRRRDRIAAVLRNRWREKEGLQPVPLPSLDPAPVAAESVEKLLPDLAGDDEPKRAAARDALRALGAGAWEHVRTAVADASGVRRERLEAASFALANTLRDVVVRGDAGALADPLKECVGRPFDPEEVAVLVKAASVAPMVSAFAVEVERDEDGRGIVVVVDATRGEKRAGEPREFEVTAAGGVSAVTRGGMEDGVQVQLLRPFVAELQRSPHAHVYRFLRVATRW